MSYYLFLNARAMTALFMMLLLYLAYTQTELCLHQTVQNIKLYASADHVLGRVESLQQTNYLGINAANIECPVIQYRDRQKKIRNFVSDDCRWYKPISSNLTLLFPPFINQYHVQQTVSVLFDGNDAAEIDGIVVLVLIPLFHFFMAFVFLCLTYLIMMSAKK